MGISGLAASLADTEYDYLASPLGFAAGRIRALQAPATFVESTAEPASGRSRFELGHTEDRRTTEAPMRLDLQYLRDQANWINRWKLNSAQTLYFGADWYQDRRTSSNDSIATSRINRAGLAPSTSFKRRTVSLTELGVRHDRNQSNSAAKNTWNAAGNAGILEWAENDLILS